MIRLVAIVFDAFWLGWLRREQMHALDAAYYDERTEQAWGERFLYADEAYNTRGLWEWEQPLLERAFAPDTSVVVAGAGGGRETLALLERGVRAIGFEANPALAAAGERILAARGYPGGVHHCARDVFPSAAPPCDGVLVGWATYTLIAGSGPRVAFLRAARARLEPGAPLVLSFFAVAAHSRYAHALARLASVLRRVRGEPPAEVGDTLDENFTHVFTRAELVGELERAGFALEDFAYQPGWALARAV